MEEEQYLLSQKEKSKAWKKAKEELKDLIHPKYFDFAESQETYWSEGIVEIELTDEKRPHYPNYQCCRIKGDKSNLLYMHHTCYLDTCQYPDSSPYEGEEIEYYVYQETGMLGDDYYGFLLLPLKNGKWWKIDYSC